MSATIHLQGIGSVPAVPLSEVQAGDVLMWNSGVTTEVVAVAPGAKTISLTTRSNDGQLWTNRKRGTTLVARIKR